MTTYTIMIFATMLLAQAYCATEANQNSIKDSIKSPADLSYGELVYILQARIGIPQKPVTLTPCARAILGCCNEKQMNEECSEELKCGAFFFDDNPCDDKFIIEALKAASAFYNQLKTD